MKIYLILSETKEKNSPPTKKHILAKHFLKCFRKVKQPYLKGTLTYVCTTYIPKYYYKSLYLKEMKKPN